MVRSRRSEASILGAAMAMCAALACASCVAGGGASAGLYVDTNGDFGAAVRGHATLLGFRISDAPDERPSGAPLLGVEMGPAFSFIDSVWRLQVGVPLAAATWDDLGRHHGMRLSPQFVMDYAWRYDGAKVHEAYGGAVAGAYLRHLSMQSERYANGPDAVRIHRLGPVAAVSVLWADTGEWSGLFFLGVMYDYEAYVASGK